MDSGEILIQYRGDRSREDVARELGIKAHTLYCYERGYRDLDSVSRLRELAALLIIPLSLLGLAENEPDPGDLGQVVKDYRQSKNWSQSDLAQALGLCNLQVRNMENKGLYLNSVTRRRALSFLLSIPPVALGLDGLLSAAGSGSAPLSLHSLRELQVSLWTGYYAAHAQDRVAFISSLTRQIDTFVASAGSGSRLGWIEQQSLLYQFLSNVVREYNPDVAVAFADRAISSARSIGGDLLVVALVRRAELHTLRGCFAEAATSSREALSLKVTDPQIASGRALSSAYVLSPLALDRVDRLEIYRFLDSATAFPSRGLGLDLYGFSVEADAVRMRSAQSLIAAAGSTSGPDRLSLALQAKRFLEQDPEGSPRRLLQARLAQAQIALALNEPEQAVSSALEAVQISQQIKSALYLPQIAEVYRAAKNVVPGPVTERLGLLLSQNGIVE